jgi:hypothetical protein
VATRRTCCRYGALRITNDEDAANKPVFRLVLHSGSSSPETMARTGLGEPNDEGDKFELDGRLWVVTKRESGTAPDGTLVVTLHCDRA